MNFFKNKGHFQVRHLLALFAVLVIFQLVLSYINTTSTGNLLSRTMDMYRKDLAENMADLTTTSLEMLLENIRLSRSSEFIERRNAVRELNILYSQPTLQQNISQISILVQHDGGLSALNDGEQFYAYFIEKHVSEEQVDPVLRWFYEKYSEKVFQTEQILSDIDEQFVFNILVPFVPQGELEGVLYMKVSPDFSNIYQAITTSYNESSAIFSSLIILSLLIMFYMSSYTIRERNIAQEQLFEKRQQLLKTEVEHQKEAVFTQRIYHAHHKAEKVMGFIKTDLRQIRGEEHRDTLNRVSKYANFVARVIYDMKSYEPPIDVIRNPIFQTNVNDVLRFLVDNIFRRTESPIANVKFHFELDEALPVVSINEFVVWEILEPLIQNCIEHNNNELTEIRIITTCDAESGKGIIYIGDNGAGIGPDLLTADENGVKPIFKEHVTTKENSDNSGYGCYLAYEIAARRCGWSLDAVNDDQGACFIIEMN